MGGFGFGGLGCGRGCDDRFRGAGCGFGACGGWGDGGCGRERCGVGGIRGGCITVIRACGFEGGAAGCGGGGRFW